MLTNSEKANTLRVEEGVRRKSRGNVSSLTCYQNVVWMVSGRDKAGVKAAVEILTNRWDELRYVYAIAIVNGEVIKIP